MKSADAKDQILQKTFRLLLEKGYDGVSITDIQQATGLSRGLLYHYFENKETLFSEVVRTYFTDLWHQEPGSDSFDLPEMIESAIRMHERLCSRALSDRKANLRDYDFLFYRMLQEDIAFSRELGEVRKQEKIVWRQAAARSAERGQLRNGLDLDIISQSFIFLMDGIWMQAINEMSPQPLIDEIRKTLHSYFKLIAR